MKIYSKFINLGLVLILLNFPISLANSKTFPNSFADLAEKLMPSVVNISSTQTIKTTSNPFPFQFPFLLRFVLHLNEESLLKHLSVKHTLTNHLRSDVYLREALLNENL